MYVFRNHTLENFFPKGTEFSGYGDISSVPESDRYLWFYNVPAVFDTERLCAEIASARGALEMVCNRIPAGKPFYIMTLENLYAPRLCDTDRRVEEAVDAVNRTARELSEKLCNVKVIDFGEFLERYLPEERVNWQFYFLSQMILSPSLAAPFKKWLAARIAQIGGARKKCIVTDLDNTLWSGILGEDGISGVRMSGDYPGNAFMYFQEGLKKLSEQGVIIAVCSKNNEKDVEELWEKNPFVVLSPKYISARRINWNNKADNIRELAEELNIGLDSMVFVDDNPSERELVRHELPMVAVPDFPDKPYGLMSLFTELCEKYFRSYSLTDEDRSKAEQYRANARRSEEASHFSNMDDFIRSLGIHIEIMPADRFNIPRISQMTQKTNQFNLTTRRWSEADIEGLLAGGGDVYCLSVSARFGSYGITGTIALDREGNEAKITNMLMSCRVLGKGIENAFVNAVLNIMRNEGVKTVHAEYVPTEKNGQTADFYDRLGFTLTTEHDGTKEYTTKLDHEREEGGAYTVEVKI